MSDEELEPLYVPQVKVEPVLPGLPRVAGPFLCGPIPLSWLGRACGLGGGKTLATALGLWWLAGLRRRKDNLTLTSKCLARFGVDRWAKSRALVALEEAGLVRVRRQPRKNPVVTILEVGPGDEGPLPA